MKISTYAFMSLVSFFVVLAISLMNINCVQLGMGQLETSSNITADSENQFSLLLSTPRYNYFVNETISVFGNLLDSEELVADQIIKIQANINSTDSTDGIEPYYQAHIRTDQDGNFNASIPSPLRPGIASIIATYNSTNATLDVPVEARTTVLVNPLLPPPRPAIDTHLQQLIGTGAFVPLLAFIINIISLVLTYPKHEKIGLIIASISAAIGTIFIPALTEYIPDPNAAAAITAAVIGSLGANVYKAIEARRAAGREVERAVSTYRDEHLKDEVKSLSAIFEELSAHQATFMSTNELLSNRLSREKYEKSVKTGTMANLPGLRLNQYYFYVEYYNKLVEYKVLRLGELSDDKIYQEFVNIFRDIKNSFSQLNELLYVNLLYSIGEIQNRFLSFPTVQFPVRTSNPLLLRLQKAGIFTKNGLSPDKIYTDEIANKLMSIIGPEFRATFIKLDTHFSAIINLVPPPLEQEEKEKEGEKEQKEEKEQQRPSDGRK